MKVISLHHDISTTTGEEVILFTLAESPLFRSDVRCSLTLLAFLRGE